MVTPRQSQPHKPTPNRKAAQAKPQVKVINLRERVRILDKALIWTEESLRCKVREQGKRIQQLSQDNLLLRADVCGMKKAMFRELVHQKANNQKV